MKLIVERDAFADALGTAKHSTVKGPDIPILKNALLTVTGSKLHIAATNLDMRIEMAVPCDVEEDDGANAITCSVSLLSDLAARFPKGSQLCLKWNAQTANVTVSAGRASYKLHALNADMFPQLTSPDDAVKFTMPGKRLAAALNMVRWATSDKLDLAHLGGVNVHLGSNALEQLGGDKTRRLFFAATDGYQAARHAVDLPEGLTHLPKLIVPNAALPEIARLANEASDDVEIAVSDNLFSITAGTAVFVTKWIDREFPDYERMIFPSEVTALRVDIEALQSALLRLKTLGNNNRTKADITPDEITLSVISQEAGAADEVVPVEYEGEPITRVLSAGGILSVLDHMQSDVALFRLAERGRPIMVNAIVGENVDYTRTFVTMPMEGK